MNVSDSVKKIIEDQPFIVEALARGIIHVGNLATEIKPTIESRLEKTVTDAAIIMAIRRHADEIKQKSAANTDVSLDCSFMMKTNICDFNVVNSNKLLRQLKSFYDIVDLERGDFLNVTIGSHEVSIAVNQKHAQHIEAGLKGERILNQQNDLVALTLLFNREFFHTPGITYQVLQVLAWKGINLLEIISTLTELTVIVEKKDAIKSYEVIHELIDRFGSE